MSKNIKPSKGYEHDNQVDERTKQESLKKKKINPFLGTSVPVFSL